jgi:hypothetical protein
LEPSDHLREFLQVASVHIRDGPVVHPAFSPVDKIVATLGQGLLTGAHVAGGRPDEEIDEVLAPLIDQRRHGVLGISAELLGLYIRLAAVTDILPQRFRFARYKLWM